jgi:hypothetical protein
MLLFSEISHYTSEHIPQFCSKIYPKQKQLGSPLYLETATYQ